MAAPLSRLSVSGCRLLQKQAKAPSLEQLVYASPTISGAAAAGAASSSDAAVAASAVGGGGVAAAGGGATVVATTHLSSCSSSSLTCTSGVKSLASDAADVSFPLPSLLRGPTSTAVVTTAGATKKQQHYQQQQQEEEEQEQQHLQRHGTQRSGGGSGGDGGEVVAVSTPTTLSSHTHFAKVIMCRGVPLQTKSPHWRSSLKSNAENENSTSTLSTASLFRNQQQRGGDVKLFTGRQIYPKSVVQQKEQQQLLLWGRAFSSSSSSTATISTTTSSSSATTTPQRSIEIGGDIKTSNSSGHNNSSNSSSNSNSNNDSSSNSDSNKRPEHVAEKEMRETARDGAVVGSTLSTSEAVCKAAAAAPAAAATVAKENKEQPEEHRVDKGTNAEAEEGAITTTAAAVAAAGEESNATTCKAAERQGNEDPLAAAKKTAGLAEAEANNREKTSSNMTVTATTTQEQKQQEGDMRQQDDPKTSDVKRPSSTEDKQISPASQRKEGEGEGKGEVHAFRAETKKLLQIVTHSLYTDKEIFIRELISNSADALEKLRFLQATSSDQTDPSRASLPLEMCLSGDPENKTFTLEDTGLGMTKEELLEHLGTIAKSGSLEFLMKHHGEKNADIIGQFGVGFYSSFVVSDRVVVYSRSHIPGSKAYVWSSDGSGEFTIKELPETSETAKKLLRGTKIVCHLRNDSLEFSNIHTLQSCATKFSSFINFPISIREKNGRLVAVTTQEALWLKPKATQEEHTQFFRYLSNQSWGQPMYTITYRADAPLSIKALFYVPEDPPSRLFQSSNSNEVGVSLHARRVLVQRAATEVIPRWMGFLRGVVDCDDMPLNVSRERMQNTALMEKLSHVLVRRVLRFFEEQAQTDPKKYLSFYCKYAQQIKEGVLDDAHHGSRHKNELLQLLRFQCSEKADGELISLDEYLKLVKPEQQNIYVYCCPGRETALASPYMEQFKKKKRPVLLLTDDIDEFVTMNVQTYKGKKFVAIDSPEEDFEPLLEEDDDATTDAGASLPGLVGLQRQELERFAQSTLGGRVSAVRFSDRLVKTPAVVTGFLSSTLRKMMKATLQGAPEAQLKMASLPVTLELNPHHQLVSSIYHLMRLNPDVAKLLVEQIYDNARVAAGLMEDPRCMLERLNQLLEMTAQYAYHYGKAGASAAAAEQADATESGSKAADSVPDTSAATKTADGEKPAAEKKESLPQKEDTHNRAHL